MKFICLLLSFTIFSGKLAFTQVSDRTGDDQTYQEVINYHLNELKSNPQNLESSIILMETYYQIEDYRKALNYANIAEDIFQHNFRMDTLEMSDHDSAVLFYILQTRGKSRHKIADYRKAKIDYMVAYAINPTDSDLLVDIGNLYYNMEQYDSALFFLKEPIMNLKMDLKPNSTWQTRIMY